MRSISFTHIGKRSTNQDVISIQRLDSGPYIYLVVDGMGGYEEGEEAAKLVSENLIAFLSMIKDINTKDIQNAVNKANFAIKQHQKTRRIKCGATVGGVIISNDHGMAFWVGDVKIFHLKKKCLVNESRSHSLINEITSNTSILEVEQIDKYKHIVTRSVQGEVYNSKIDSFLIEPIDENDLFIICSDGVHNIINGLGIELLLNKAGSIEQALIQIEDRLLKESPDNFSLIAVLPEL